MASGTIAVSGIKEIDFSAQITWGTAAAVVAANKSIFIYYQPLTKMVYGTLSIYGDSNITTADVLFTIPSGYRPHDNVGAVGMISNSSGEWYPYAVRFQTNGNVTQQLTSSCRRIYCYFQYQV